MKINNLLDLKSWRIEKDSNGSDFKILDDEIIALELKKAAFKNENKLVYCNVKIFLDYSFDDRFFNIPACKGFRITYKTGSNNKVLFIIEEHTNKYNFFYSLPPSKDWTTKTIKFNDEESFYITNSRIDLNNITGFIFSFDSFNKEEIVDRLYIKDFSIIGYEINSIQNMKNRICKKYLIKKNFLNSLKLIVKKTESNKINLIDSDGNPLYCIYPFYQYLINFQYFSVCNRINIEENYKSINDGDISKIWFGKKFDKVRECIKNLSYSECNLKECVQIISSRKSLKNIYELRNEYSDIADYIEGKTDKFRVLPKYVEVGFDSTCNLKCRSCTVDAKLRNSTEVCKKYIQEIEKIGDKIELLIMAAYGEPFAAPAYKEWLFNFSLEKFPKLEKFCLMTNAILWTEKNWSKVSCDIKKLNIEAIISIDGATKETYEFNRENAKFEILQKNLKYIASLRKKNEVNSLVLRHVVQENNFKELPSIIDFAKRYSFDNIIIHQIRNWGSYTKEEFNKINIFDKKHKEYIKFKNIYKKVKLYIDEKIDIEFAFKM